MKKPSFPDPVYASPPLNHLRAAKVIILPVKHVTHSGIIRSRIPSFCDFFLILTNVTWLLSWFRSALLFLSLRP